MTEIITYKLTGEKSKFKLLKQIMKEFGIVPILVKYKQNKLKNELKDHLNHLTKSEKESIRNYETQKKTEL